MMRVCLLCVLLCLPAAAVDSITVSDLGGQVTQCVYNWTSDGSGAAMGRTSVALPGVLFAVFTEPSGSAVPTASYDVVVKQSFTSLTGTDVVLSTDLAGGALADRSNSGAQLVPFWPDTVQQVSGKVEVVISNAGSAKSGKVVVQVVRGLRMSASDVQLPLTGGSLGQIVQYESAGRGKWSTMSGEATMADGGAVDLQGSPNFTTVTAAGTISGGTVNSTGTGSAGTSFTAGGGYGNSGVTLSTTGDVSANGNAIIDGTATVSQLTATHNNAVTLREDSNSVNEGPYARWQAKDSGGSYTTYASVFSNIVTNTAGAVSGKLLFDVTNSGTINNNQMVIYRNYVAVNTDLDVSADLDVAGRVDVGAKLVFDQQAATIASGVITATRAFITITSESSTADDLVTISGGVTGETIIIQAFTGHTITLKHGTGNLQLQGSADIALNGLGECAQLFFNGISWMTVPRT